MVLIKRKEGRTEGREGGGEKRLWESCRLFPSWNNGNAAPFSSSQRDTSLFEENGASSLWHLLLLFSIWRFNRLSEVTESRLGRLWCLNLNILEEKHGWIRKFQNWIILGEGKTELGPEKKPLGVLGVESGELYGLRAEKGHRVGEVR